MLDLKFVRENLDAVKENIRRKNESADPSEIAGLDAKRRELIGEGEELKSRRNTVSKEIASLKKNKQDASEQIEAMQSVSRRIKEIDDELRDVGDKMREILIKIPNMLHESVPTGKSESDNVVVRTWGEPRESAPKTHMDIAAEKGIIDFERASKVAGAGFTFYVGKGARLERALINFMLDIQTEKNGYTEIVPPFLANPEAMTGTAQLPKMKDDMYRCDEDDVYLIPTSEVPLTYFSAGEMLSASDLPKKFCAYSPCFRREAGSYGKEVRGCLRVHQFNKVELVKLALPETSFDELETLTADAESILQALELPYRVSLLSSGDTSFASSKTYDLEVWSPGEKLWLEVSSCSNFGDFQARRSNIRFKRDPKSKPEFVHTLNGSGLATSRIVVALLENGLQDDGKIKIPEVLSKYAGFDYI